MWTVLHGIGNSSVKPTEHSGQVYTKDVHLYGRTKNILRSRPIDTQSSWQNYTLIHKELQTITKQNIRRLQYNHGQIQSVLAMLRSRSQTQLSLLVYRT